MKTTLAVSLLAASLVAVTSVGFAVTPAENWDNHCAKCHGADGAGNTKIGKKLRLPDYTDPAVQAAMKDEDVFKAIMDGVVENGKERMKAFKDDLTDAEITELVAYIRTMKK
jgi:mono/diheme cytochrome c family protein